MTIPKGLADGPIYLDYNATARSTHASSRRCCPT